MSLYHLELACKEIRRHWVMALLIALQLSVGVGAFVATTQLRHALARDPLPDKSDRLVYVQLDPRSSKFAIDGIEPPVTLTYTDAKFLLDAGWAKRQSMSVGGAVKILPPDGHTPFFVDARATTADFFAMFEVPLEAGHGWNKQDDAQGARVALITQALGRRLFGDEDPVGKVLRLGMGDYTVLGVIGDFDPQPRFYDLLHQGAHGSEQVFLPFSAVPDVDNGNWGDADCWSTPDNVQHIADQPCFWVNFWAELSDASQRPQLLQRLTAYSLQQKEAGRYEVPPNVRLRTLTQWLSYNHAVPSQVRLESWLAVGFLGVCLVNAMGLLLTKFFRMSQSIGMRRALGASSRSIVSQLLVEAGAYGVVGGLLSMGMTWIGLWAVRFQDAGFSHAGRVAATSLVASFAVTVGCAVIAGVLPAWRCVRVPLHLQLKSS